MRLPKWLNLVLRLKKEVRLEDQIVRLLLEYGTMDCPSICVKLCRKEKEIRQALISLVESGCIELRFDDWQTENTRFAFVPWQLAQTTNKKEKEKKLALAKRALGIISHENGEV